MLVKKGLLRNEPYEVAIEEIRLRHPAPKCTQVTLKENGKVVIWELTGKESPAELNYHAFRIMVMMELYVICGQLGIDIEDFKVVYEMESKEGPLKSRERLERALIHGLSDKYFKNLRIFEKFLNMTKSVLEDFITGRCSNYGRIRSDFKVIKRNYESWKEWKEQKNHGKRYDEHSFIDDITGKLWQLAVFTRRARPEWWEEDNKIRDECAQARVDKQSFDMLKDKRPLLYERLKDSKEVRKMEELADMNCDKLKYI